ncbi:MAG: Wzz/FepE/Etk N-terminal domain-containing protein [Lachnospiraceae bacterium]|nr:Wzz/FepE/Etk N-terminal domain-containing protein [Lachnospiraceae bacterium]
MDSKELRRTHQQSRTNEAVTIDLGEIFGLIWAQKVIVILVTVFCALLTYIGVSLLATPMYTSETSILILSRQDQNTVTSSDLQTATQLTADYLQLVTTRPVLEEAISQSGSKLSVSELRSHVSVTNETNTRILQISVSDPDPTMARKLANALRESVSTRITQVMNIDAVNTVETASLPTSPSSPNVKRDVLIGALLGLLVTIVVLVVRYLLDDTVKTSDDVEKYTGLTVLGTIPMSEGEKSGRRRKKSTGAQKSSAKERR